MKLKKPATLVDPCQTFDPDVATKTLTPIKVRVPSTVATNGPPGK